MTIHWLRRLGRARLLAMAILSVFLGTAVVDTAEARIGRSGGGGSFRSFGSRGSRGLGGGGGFSSPFGSGGTTRSAPSANSGRGGLFGNRNNNRGRQGSWFQRNPFMAGLLGGLAGTVIGSMLMNALGGMGAFSNVVGFLMLAMLALGAFALIKALMNRGKTNYVGAGAAPTNFGANTSTNFGSAYGSQPAGNRTFDGSATAGNAVHYQTREQGLAAIALEDSTQTQEQLKDTISARFFGLQEAWSNADRSAIQGVTTDEMFREFTAELDDMQRRGERNVIKNISIRSFEITEAWQEGGDEYLTAHINARLLDYTERGGQVISGDATNPVHFNEFWTFVRDRGRGQWKLSAIEQEN